MKNCPCVDMELIKKLINKVCEEKGLDEKPFMSSIDEGFIGWFSRSMATALFVFCKNSHGDWCVLASERGIESADFHGMWNCPCGYLDYDETTRECAVRECFEETGVKRPSESIEFIGYEDDPITANRQNVTFRFMAKITDKVTSDFEFSKKNNEGKEVGEIAWIKLSDVDKYQWAFDHDKRIGEILKNNW